MKIIGILFFLSFIFISCKEHLSYNRDYFLRTTGLSIPYAVDVKESFDDADGHTGVLFSLTPKQLKAFIAKKNFKTTVGDKFWNVSFPATVGKSFFKNYQYPKSAISTLYYKYGDAGRTQSELVAWLCMIDTKTNLVWITILYPGLADG